MLVFCSSLENSSVGSFLAALKHCTISRDLERGRELHTQAINTGLFSNLYIGNSLINMYSKCRSMEDAQVVFDSLVLRDEVSWNSLFRGYLSNGENELGLEVFDGLRKAFRGRVGNPKTYVAAISACVSLAKQSRSWMEKAEEIFLSAAANSCRNVFVENSMINLYGESGCLERAQELFDRMSERDVVTWNTLLRAFQSNGRSDLALELFREMQEASSCSADARSFVAALEACSSLGKTGDEPEVNRRLMETGMELHARALENGCCDKFVKTTLINMYSRFGRMDEAREVFESLGTQRDTVAWNTLLQGYVENGESEVALELFESKVSSPDSRTFLIALNACGALGARDKKKKNTSGEWLRRGKEIHLQALEKRCCNTFVENTLISMYTQCGCLEVAKQVFDEMPERDIISWNSLLHGLCENGESLRALELFDALLHSSVDPNARSFIAAISACSALGREWLGRGKLLHSAALRSGSCCGIYVENSLIEMYSSCGSLASAQQVFESMPLRSEVTWNSMIQAFADNGEGSLALELFHGMKQGKTPATFIAALRACGDLTALGSAKGIDRELTRLGFEGGLAACLVECYGKCGRMDDAQLVFDSANVSCEGVWNALLGGYSRNGDPERFFQALKMMKEGGVQGTSSTLTHLLATCGHAGFAEKGWKMFRSLSEEWGLKADLVHWSCLVDMVGRAEKMEVGEVMKVMRNQCFGSLRDLDSVAWMTLLGACGNAESGNVVFQELLQKLKPGRGPGDAGVAAAACVSMGNLYASQSSHLI